MEGEKQPKAELTLFALHYQTVQRLRVAICESLRKREEETGMVPSVRASAIAGTLEGLERDVVEHIVSIASQHPAYPWLISIKGIGPRLSGVLLGLLEIERAPHISSFWKYCGMGVTDGKSDRRVKGQKLSYNATLKKTCWLVATSFVRLGTEPYVSYYRAHKERLTAGRPHWLRDEKGKAIKGGKLHVDLAARRIMVKIFLAHLWMVWRETIGMPTEAPWIIGREDAEGRTHANIIPPPNWPLEKVAHGQE